jgi:hypothetical protein
VAPLLVIELEQPVAVPGNAENGGKVELEKLLRYRPSTGIIQTPPSAICENAPAQVSGG